jgi:hypothetical protein
MATKSKKLTQEEREAIRAEVYGQLNIKTDFSPYEGEARTSSFSEEPAAWKRGNRLYSQAEYERTNGRRAKLQNRADRLVEERVAAAEGRNEQPVEAEATTA